jgi:chromosome partitioning protein
LGPTASQISPTLTDYFKAILDLSYQASEANTYIHPTPFENLFILPATTQLEGLQGPLLLKAKLYKLRSLLDQASGFDAIFMDTPPALGFFTQSALISASSCLIPFDCDLFAHNAIYNLIDGLTQVRNNYHAQLRVEGIIVNQFQAQASLPNKLVNTLKEEGLPIISSFISSSIMIRNSHDAFTPMIHFAPKHKITLEFLRIYQSLQTNTIFQPDALPKWVPEHEANLAHCID